MRRCIQILGLILLAIMAGGWGSVAAAVFCPHLNGSASKAGSLSSSWTEHACHPARPAVESKPHCHDSGMGQEDMGEIADTAGLPETSGEGAWLGTVDDALCSHCMGRSELPNSSAVARQQPQPRRGIEPVAAQAASPLVSAGFIIRPAVLYRQGAPPGSLPPKHLLLGVLLI